MPQSASRVHSCRELVTGNEVQAKVGDVVHFRGRVIDMHEPMELFWAVDSVGERRILEFREYAIYLMADSAPTDAES
ncbi:hypothetical protein [Sinomonas sp. ASV322]|uniref:hypothetical protein n=1 Tax=Sinomonas sp. ASV322 TaxID=3041920 RepID=UPI0027DBAAD4|nr:hypothetical protein [Sinomonas sp. ASV322]MDQ4501291.1 hypothetical protein [Sinomonas sp. ASV322]